MPITTKTFESDTLVPAVPATGDSLEELVNAFLATISPNNLLDTLFHSFSSSKYGTAKTHTAVIVYKS